MKKLRPIIVMNITQPKEGRFLFGEVAGEKSVAMPPKRKRAPSGPRLDALVCNAGVLQNTRTLTTEGIETTFACHLLFGTYLLSMLARPILEATPGSRVVVVSSGGMYNTKFPRWSEAVGAGEYNGNMAYDLDINKRPPQTS